ncbi:carbohydrate binding domain-containing protein [Arenibacter sp. F26102]|uniref:carbohydrate binding domain-containing protein n=1 Tax=Arenibacter sp. F26102 TaxID=2926416 RepID=UPI001FF154E4|nr:carbohydrate binding domain-containing protein [Arenibacter sp. F26102]MCK0147647.1 carbohydrate binding domain-containing protein [Arenibacter sp. F26102]
MKKTCIFREVHLWVFGLVAVLLSVFVSCSEDKEDMAGGVTGVSMKTLPKVAYVIGEELDLTTLVITLEKGDSEVQVPFTSFGLENITVDPANGTELDFSNQSLSINHKGSGKGLIQSIIVTNNVVSVAVKNKPRESYVNGEKLDLGDLVVSLAYEDGSLEDKAFADFGNTIQTTPANGTVLSEVDSEVVITYVSTNASATQSVQVEAFTPSSATIATPPNLVNYEIGDRLKLEGAVIKYSLVSGTELKIPYIEFEAFGIVAMPANEDKLKASDTAVEIRHEATGVVAMLPITVNPLDVTGMSVAIKPEKTLYRDGEIIELNGLSIKLEINGGEDVVVSSADFDTYGILATPADGEAFVDGTTEILISYPGYSGAAAIPLGSEIIYESDFSSGIDGWKANQNGGGSLSMESEDGVLVARDIVLGAKSWDVQIMRSSLPLEEGAKYKMTITMKAMVGQGDFWLSFSVGDGTGRDSYQAYDGGGNGAWLSNNDQYVTEEKEFVMGKASTTGARILLDVGKQTNGIVIQYVKLEKL